MKLRCFNVYTNHLDNVNLYCDGIEIKEDSVFFYILLPNDIRLYIAGLDFMDLGAIYELIDDEESGEGIAKELLNFYKSPK